jgi:hypothetical protein
LADYDEVHYLTWRFVLEYLYVIGECNAKLTIRNVSTIFSDILFRPLEVKSADMEVWRHFTDLLVLMITEHQRIFEIVDACRALEEQKKEALASSSEANEEAVR